MNSKSISTCQNCDQLFCAECSDASRPFDYCTTGCQEAYENYLEQEPIKWVSNKRSDIKKRFKRS